MNCLSSARKYLKRGWSVIPVGKDKRPAVPWTEFQSRRPLDKELDSWFTDGVGIGIVTGKLSDLSVIDVDSSAGASKVQELLGDGFEAPTVHTPRGGYHLYCLGSGLANNTRAIEGVDFRGEGGFVVAPPTTRADGKSYAWDDGSNLDTVPIPPLPDAYVMEVMRSISSGEGSYSLSSKLLEPGTRNNDLFHYAYRLGIGKTDMAEAQALITWVGGRAGISPRECDTIVRSAYERATRDSRNLSNDIRELVDGTTGDFSVTDLRRDLQIVTKQDKSTLHTAITRLRKEGVIEKAGRRDGVGRKVEQECDAVDFINAPTEPLRLSWPFELEQMTNIYQKSVIVIAGRSNAGKTCFMIDLAKRNQADHEIHYFSSEMGGSEARVRLSKHDDIKIEEWKFNMWNRSTDFPDVIRPDAINIIDYLESLDGEEYKVKAYISQIWNKLQKGIAVIAIQKKRGTDVGYGGEGTMARSRLYLAVDEGIIRIVKAKDWGGERNPNGMSRTFKLVQGWKFIPTSDWMTRDDAEAMEMAEKAGVDPKHKKQIFNLITNKEK